MIRNQVVFALSILTLCLCQPVLAQSSTEENKVVSKVPLRNFEGAWSEAQVREWANGPLKEWLDKTALFFSMLTPQNWALGGPIEGREILLGALRAIIEAGQLHLPAGQDNHTLLLSQPYSLSATLGILTNIRALNSTLDSVTGANLTAGPSQELRIELINHKNYGIGLSSRTSKHVNALIKWYEAAVAPPQW